MRRGSLGIGLALCGLGVVLALAPSGSAALGWAAHWWPVLPILVGASSLLGFATRRSPRSPLRGAALLVVGALALALTLRSAASPLALYGRFWPVLLGVVALVEILRYYTHRPELGEARPKLFGAGKLALVGAIVVSGLGAHRVAEADPNFLANVSMPAGLDHLRDELFGEAFRFDPITKTAALPTSGVVSVTNKYGDIVVVAGDTDAVEVSVVPTVRAYDRGAAERVAAKLALVVEPDGAGLRVATNRDDIDHEIGTEIRLTVPKTADVRLSQSHGRISVTGLSPRGGRLAIDAPRSPVALASVTAAVEIKNTNDIVEAIDCSGSLSVEGRTNVTVKGCTGTLRFEDSDAVWIERVTAPTIDLVSVDHADVSIDGVTGPSRVSVDGDHSTVKLKSIDGDVSVRSSHGSVTADAVKGSLAVDASHSDVSATRVGGSLTVTTDHDDVRATGVAGRVDITNDHGGVVVSDFGGECAVRTSFDSVRLAAGADQTGDVSVENEHGRIEVALAPDRGYRVSPTVERGQVRMDSAFARTAGGDGSRVVLKTSYDDIVVRAASGQTAGRGPA